MASSAPARVFAPDATLTLDGVAYGLSYDYSTDGGPVWRWQGETPTCPQCLDALHLKEHARIYPTRAGFYVLTCDCGWVERLS